VLAETLVVQGDLVDRNPAGLAKQPAHHRSVSISPARKFGASPGPCERLCHRARRQGDIGAGHPRAHRRRLRPDPAIHRRERQNLAIQLRSGALPAKLTIVEERTVGPSLGADSIDAGKKAGLVGLAATAVLTILAYGTFGIYAVIGLLVRRTAAA
jgi:hypothetical protein